MGSQPVILNGEGASIAERFWACVTTAMSVLCGVRRLPAPVQLACGPVGRGALGDALTGGDLPPRNEVPHVHGGPVEKRGGAAGLGGGGTKLVPGYLSCICTRVECGV